MAWSVEAALERLASATVGFVVGNGRSREGIDLEALRERGVVAGCNAIYRDFTPDLLVTVDPGMTEEVRAADPPCPHVYSGAAGLAGWAGIPLTSNIGCRFPFEWWSAGHTAAAVLCRLAPRLETLTLLGIDLSRPTLYEGTPNYERDRHLEEANLAQYGPNWKLLMEQYPSVQWRWCRPFPEMSAPEMWRDVPNLTVLEEWPRGIPPEPQPTPPQFLRKGRMASIIHLGTRIISGFAVVDDAGNAFPLQPMFTAVPQPTPEAFQQACVRWEERLRELCEIPEAKLLELAALAPDQLAETESTRFRRIGKVNHG